MYYTIWPKAFWLQINELHFLCIYISLIYVYFTLEYHSSGIKLRLVLLELLLPFEVLHHIMSGKVWHKFQIPHNRCQCQVKRGAYLPEWLFTVEFQPLWVFPKIGLYIVSILSYNHWLSTQHLFTIHLAIYLAVSDCLGALGAPYTVPCAASHTEEQSPARISHSSLSLASFRRTTFRSDVVTRCSWGPASPGSRPSAEGLISVPIPACTCKDHLS